jgi:hypothetical protein
MMIAATLTNNNDLLVIDSPIKRKRGRPPLNKGYNMSTPNVTPTGTTETAPATTGTKTTTKTVLDLGSFDKVTLIKNVPLPEKPKTLAEATALVGNNMDRLMELIFQGLSTEAIEKAREDQSNWFVMDGPQKFGAAYTGSFADEAKTDNINLMILNLAKAGGYNQDLPLAERNRLKDQAKAFIKANPAMIQFISGATAPSTDAKKELDADLKESAE